MTSRARHGAEHDLPTEVSNRSIFQKRLQGEIHAASRSKRSLALCILGLDRFREINHIFGVQVGDSLLREVGRRFASVTDGCRARTRLGGDEFAAVFRDATATGVEALCAEILGVLKIPFIVQDVPIDLSGSIGLALFPEHGEGANLLFQTANIALDRAKQFARGYALYEPEDNPYSQKNWPTSAAS